MTKQHWTLLLTVTTFLITTDTWAQRRSRDVLEQLYPYQPMPLQELDDRIKRITEEAAPLTNIYDITNRGLMSGAARNKPWASSFWPLIQGQIANTWQDKSYFRFMDFFSWKKNIKKFHKRENGVLAQGMNMSENDLARLAPSEKYDLLLGGTEYDLTNRIWKFVETWGNYKTNGFLSSIQMPAGYRLPKASNRIALWEGICHGWALAAGGYPKPQRTVNVTLPNGKRMPFYPADVQAIVALTFANSVVQNETIIEGYRCNAKSPQQDEYGRFIDSMPSRDEIGVLPRCADVHPAVWHLAIVNLMGIQRRSFVVEIDANAKVNNHPLESYSYEYFNPKTGRVGDLTKSMVAVEDFRRDPYIGSRNPNTRYIVGVDMRMRVTDWVMPDDAKIDVDVDVDSHIKKKDFRYDLELDANGKIVGGQWRVNRLVEFVSDSRDTTNQPDFFWTLPKDYMKHFQNMTGLPDWRIDSGRPAPQAWKEAAIGAHSYVFQQTAEFGFQQTCPVIKGRNVLQVPCEFKHPKPQPLLNVVNQLVDLAK